LAVDRSAGDINSVAVARQWIQRKLQPFVTSQKIRRGLNSLLAPCSEFPLPSDIVLSYAVLPTRLIVL
jgi:hypothetical protein